MEAATTNYDGRGCLLVNAVKTLSNYTNHVFHTQTDAAFQSYAWQPQA